MENIIMKKKFGQNFLKNNNIIETIINSIAIEEDNLVIEVGPGAGAMTKLLVEKFDNVLAYEIDEDLKTILEKTFSDHDNIEIIFDDFIKRNIEEDISRYSAKNIYFVANLPYYITTPIINKLIDSSIEFKNIVVMVQKEVADRFCASPGSREYGSLTVYLNYFYEIKKVCNVSRNNFYPVPNVDSAVVNMELRKEKPYVKDLDRFFALVRDSFQYKRKTLKNNLKKYDLNIINNVLQRYNMDLSVRAEKIPLEVFIEISNSLE